MNGPTRREVGPSDVAGRLGARTREAAAELCHHELRGPTE